jgi:ABC-type bacteriocin/lantibiotic exporter with double-glycine peptidase domain
MENENKTIKDILNNKLIRIVLAALFFLFIYKIVYNILIFFSIDENLVQMYMAWVAVFILLISILPYNRYAV